MFCIVYFPSVLQQTTVNVVTYRRKKSGLRISKYKMAAAVVLNFTKRVILNPQWPSYGTTYLFIKVGAIIFTWDRDMAKEPDSWWRSPPSWISPNMWLWHGTVYSICTLNMMQIDEDMTEVHLFVYFEDGGRPLSWICYTPFRPPMTFLTGSSLPIS